MCQFKGPGYPEVKGMAVEKVQEWGILFSKDDRLRYLFEIYQELKSTGITFPQLSHVVPLAIVKQTQVMLKPLI